MENSGASSSTRPKRTRRLTEKARDNLQTASEMVKNLTKRKAKRNPAASATSEDDTDNDDAAAAAAAAAAGSTRNKEPQNPSGISKRAAQAANRLRKPAANAATTPRRPSRRVGRDDSEKGLPDGMLLLWQRGYWGGIEQPRSIAELTEEMTMIRDNHGLDKLKTRKGAQQVIYKRERETLSQWITEKAGQEEAQKFLNQRRAALQGMSFNPLGSLLQYGSWRPPVFAGPSKDERNEAEGATEGEEGAEDRNAENAAAEDDTVNNDGDVEDDGMEDVEDEQDEGDLEDEEDTGDEDDMEDEKEDGVAFSARPPLSSNDAAGAFFPASNSDMEMEMSDSPLILRAQDHAISENFLSLSGDNPMDDIAQSLVTFTESEEEEFDESLFLMTWSQSPEPVAEQPANNSNANEIELDPLPSSLMGEGTFRSDDPEIDALMTSILQED